MSPPRRLESQDADLILASLERMSESGEDPAARVYARLFHANPELEALFVLGDLAKGHMLDEVIAVMLDFIGPGAYAPHFMRSEIVNHEALGVAPEVFMTFFAVVAEALREMDGLGWTEQTQAAWTRLLAALQGTFISPVAG